MDDARKPEVHIAVVAVVIHGSLDRDLVAHRHGSGRPAFTDKILNRKRFARNGEGILAAASKPEVFDRQPLDIEIRRFMAAWERRDEDALDFSAFRERRLRIPVARIAPVAADAARPFRIGRVVVRRERAGDRRTVVSELVLRVDGVVVGRRRCESRQREAARSRYESRRVQGRRQRLGRPAGDIQVGGSPPFAEARDFVKEPDGIAREIATRDGKLHRLHIGRLETACYYRLPLACIVCEVIGVGIRRRVVEPLQTNRVCRVEPQTFRHLDRFEFRAGQTEGKVEIAVRTVAAEFFHFKTDCHLPGLQIVNRQRRKRRIRHRHDGTGGKGRRAEIVHVRVERRSYDIIEPGLAIRVARTRHEVTDLTLVIPHDKRIERHIDGPSSVSVFSAEYINELAFFNRTARRRRVAVELISIRGLDFIELVGRISAVASERDYIARPVRQLRAARLGSRAIHSDAPAADVEHRAAAVVEKAPVGAVVGL